MTASKWAALALGIIVFVGTTVALFLFFRNPAPPDPIYQGKPLRVWLEDFYKQSGKRAYTLDLGGPAAQAVKDMGTNAVPYLVYLLETNRRRMADKPINWAKQETLLPADYVTAREKVMRAAVACEVLKRKARGAIPGLTNYVHDPDREIRRQALSALCFIQQEPETVIPPLLIDRLSDPDPDIQAMVPTGLTMFGAKAQSAIPALRQAMNSPDPMVSRSASNAVMRITKAAKKS